MKTLLAIVSLFSINSFAEEFNFAHESLIENQCEAKNRPDQCSLKKVSHVDNSYLILGPYTYEEISTRLSENLAQIESEPRLQKWYIAFKQVQTGNNAAGDNVTARDEVQVGAILDHTYEVGVALIGDLYTEPEDGLQNKQSITQTYSRQYFRNKTNLEFFKSTAQQGKVHYWDARVGIVSVSKTESSDILTEGFQQQMIHKAMNDTSLNKDLKYSYLNDQQSAQWGLYFSALYGYQKSFKISKKLNLLVKSTTGATISSLAKDSSVTSGTSVDLRFQLNPNYVAGLGVELNKIKHSDGLLNEYMGKVFIEGRQNDFMLKVSRFRGPLQSYVSSNTTNLSQGQNNNLILIELKHYLEPK